MFSRTPRPATRRLPIPAWVLRAIASRRGRLGLAVGAAALLVIPFVASSYELDLANQVLLASVGALALMLLTGFAGQISLGHAGLMAAGAFTVGIAYKEFGAPFWVALPASAVLGAMLGLIFGLPSVRLRGLYLAVSTLALHFVVIYLCGEYETNRAMSSAIMVNAPVVFGHQIYGDRIWYFLLLAAVVVTLILCANLLRSRTGRAWGAIRTNETVAAAMGINVPRYKLLAFVISATVTTVSGALFAYQRGFVSVDAFSFYLTIQYVAMIIIGGMPSLAGALLGATFIVLLPHAIQGVLLPMLGADNPGSAFAAIYAAFGAVMIFFLMFEPRGLLGAWRRIQRRLRFKRVPLGEVSE